MSVTTFMSTVSNGDKDIHYGCHGDSESSSYCNRRDVDIQIEINKQLLYCISFIPVDCMLVTNKPNNSEKNVLHFESYQKFLNGGQ